MFIKRIKSLKIPKFQVFTTNIFKKQYDHSLQFSQKMNFSQSFSNQLNNTNFQQNTQNSLNFKMNSQDIQTQSDSLINLAQTQIDLLIQQSQKNFQNTIQQFHKITTNLSSQINNIVFLGYVSPDGEVRQQSQKAQAQLDKFFVDLYMKEDLYKALQEYKKIGTEQGEFQKLDKESQRYVDKILNSFERNGLKLGQEEQKQIKEIQKLISEKQIQFSVNQNEDNTKLAFTREELNGLSDDFINGLSKVEGDNDLYYVTMKYPDVLPAMRLCKNENTRKKLDFANGSKNIEKNEILLSETLELRQQLAQLLEYNSYSNYKLEIKMAKNFKNVEQFLVNLTQKLIPSAQKELKQLQDLKIKETNNYNAKIESWDFQYYNNIMKYEQFQVDDQLIKEYFPMDHVIQSTLDCYQELLGLEFIEVQTFEKWHEDVQMYSVYQTDTKEFLGHFYLDLFPREGKYGHAAVFPLIKRAQLDELQNSVAAMVCNFTKPTEDKPSLLLHSEVNTFFHEFGHVMHNICTKANYSSFSGTSVERDFVECPSQLLENWVENKDILLRISKHYKTGEPLSEQIIDNMIASKYLNVSLLTLRQIFFGTFDMLVHSNQQNKTTDQDEFSWDNLRQQHIKRKNGLIDSQYLWSTLRQKITLIPSQDGTNPAADFGHIMGGYEAGYYGYLWAEVYSCDLFNKFQEEGLMNPVLGKEYRDIILAPGGSRDSSEIIQEFLGREPSQIPFLKQRGII